MRSLISRVRYISGRRGTPAQQIAVRKQSIPKLFIHSTFTPSIKDLSREYAERARVSPRAGRSYAKILLTDLYTRSGPHA